MKKLLIMAAGTGGHIFPGLAIAQTMRARGWQVSWLGTSSGMEADLVPRHGIDIDKINFTGLRGKGLLHTVRGGFKLLGSFFACLKILAQRKPDVVLGMGGYVTVPGGLMSALRRVPLVLLNADAGLLLSNKTLLPWAGRILFGLPSDTINSSAQLASKSIVTGNPVRADILQLPAPAQRYASRTGPLQLLIVGGSLGAKALNDCIPEAIALMPAAQRPRITHQSGKQHIDALRSAYAQHGIDAEVLAFIDDMPARYAVADLVICRAGAITVSELTAAGVASVLVPFLASTTTHQRDNARWMAQQQASIHLPQADMTATSVAQLLRTIDRAQCAVMAQAAYDNGRRDANEAIAAVLEKITAASLNKNESST